LLLCFVSDILRLAEATLVLLRQESSCQQVESDGEDDGDIDHDEVLMDAVSDLLPAFAKVMGSYFDPIFAKLFDPLMKFAVCYYPPSLCAHAPYSHLLNVIN
jgi:importin-4